jgi:hypothetical protein
VTFTFTLKVALEFPGTEMLDGTFTATAPLAASSA